MNTRKHIQDRLIMMFATWQDMCLDPETCIEVLNEEGKAIQFSMHTELKNTPETLDTAAVIFGELIDFLKKPEEQ